MEEGGDALALGVAPLPCLRLEEFALELDGVDDLARWRRDSGEMAARWQGGVKMVQWTVEWYSLGSVTSERDGRVAGQAGRVAGRWWHCHQLSTLAEQTPQAGEGATLTTLTP